MILDDIVQMGPLTALAVVLVVFAGAAIQATLGMGLGLIVAPVLFFLLPELVPALVIMLGMSSAIGGIAGRLPSVAFDEVWVALFGRLFGVVAAGWLLSMVEATEQFAIIFAIALLITVAMSLASVPIPFSKRTLPVGGFFSGVLGTITAVGSIPMALLYQNQEPEKARATMNAFFAIGVVPSLAALWVSGFLGVQHFIYAALLMPAVIAGAALSYRLIGFADKRYRRLVLGFAAIISSVILIQALSRVVLGS